MRVIHNLYTRMFEELKQKETLWGMLSVLFGALSVFVVIGIVGSVLFLTGVVGQESYPTKTITVEGEGKVSVKPDLSVISFTVTEEQKDITKAQNQSSEKANTVLTELKGMNIDEKDLKTTYYNISPRYEYRKVDASCIGYVCDQTRVLLGYTVTHTVQIKIRDIVQTGKVLAVLGNNGVTDFNGPNFTIDEDKDYKNEAKLLAIADARAKAKEIAKGLGVGLGRLVSYYENDGVIGYGGDMMAMDAMAPRAEMKVAPQIPAGEEEITAHVNLTYKIR